MSARQALLEHHYPPALFQRPERIRFVHRWERWAFPRVAGVWRRLQPLLRRLPSDSRVLDAGFGYGQFLHSLAAMRPDCHIEGWEREDAHLAFSEQRRAQKGWPNLHLRRVDLDQSPALPYPFDLILCVSVLQYLQHPGACLQKWRAGAMAHTRLLLYLPLADHYRHLRYDAIHRRRLWWAHSSEAASFITHNGWQVLEEHGLMYRPGRWANGLYNRLQEQTFRRRGAARWAFGGAMGPPGLLAMAALHQLNRYLKPGPSLGSLFLCRPLSPDGALR
jgi:SAM-dependent methyltransferase